MGKWSLHESDWTQSFPAEHCPEHYTAPTGPPSSHSESWCVPGVKRDPLSPGHLLPLLVVQVWCWCALCWGGLTVSYSSWSVGSDHTGQHSFPTSINELWPCRWFIAVPLWATCDRYTGEPGSPHKSCPDPFSHHHQFPSVLCVTPNSSTRWIWDSETGSQLVP